MRGLNLLPQRAILPTFQAVHDQLKQMAEEGLISVSKVERQEDGLIDAIRIQKLA